MKTLNISISDLDYDKLGIQRDSLTFSEFVELLRRDMMKQNLNKCIELSEKYGLSGMTPEEIDAEVKAVRHAKGGR